MTDRSFISFLILVAGLLFSGCEKEVASEQIPFSGLHMLTVDNDLSIRLIQDSANFIQVTGSSSAVNSVVTEINGDSIRLYNPGITEPYFSPVRADIHFTNLRVLFLCSGGDVTNADTLRLPAFTITSNRSMSNVNLNIVSNSVGIGISTGALTIVLNGRTENVNIWTTAPGLVDLRNLAAKNVKCRNNSSNDCYVWATQSLDATISFSGRVFYKGDPEIINVNDEKQDMLIPLGP